jgi:hypothetical protein
MAGPHVAGVVGLMRSANPDLDVQSIKQILIDTAVDLGTVGEDNTYGHGFVNAYAAVMAAMTNFVTVSGTVRNVAGQLPLEGVRVRSLNSGPGMLTPADGSYSLTLPAGPHPLQFSLWGFSTQTLDLELVEDTPVSQDINLAAVPSATLAGVVRNGQGLGVEGALVSVVDTPVTPVLTDADGTFSFFLPSGETYSIASRSSSGSVSQPLGPDEGGYRAFDLADGDWAQETVILPAQGAQIELQGLNRVDAFEHPVLDPEEGGVGTALDFAGDDDLTLHVDLPFPFMYYGQSFDEVSIAANGWVVLGFTASEDFSGYDIPDPADGPMSMLAPFWEDLSPGVASSGNVSTWYDAAGGRFIIEYNHIRQFTPQSAFETFAVHLLDPAVHTTTTGDGAILFWYGAVGNLDNTAIGIESPDGEQGLQIWNGRHDGNGTPGGLLEPDLHAHRRRFEDPVHHGPDRCDNYPAGAGGRPCRGRVRQCCLAFLESLRGCFDLPRGACHRPGAVVAPGTHRPDPVDGVAGNGCATLPCDRDRQLSGIHAGHEKHERVETLKNKPPRPEAGAVASGKGWGKPIGGFGSSVSIGPATRRCDCWRFSPGSRCGSAGTSRICPAAHSAHRCGCRR